MFLCDDKEYNMTFLKQEKDSNIVYHPSNPFPTVCVCVSVSVSTDMHICVCD